MAHNKTYLVCDNKSLVEFDANEKASKPEARTAGNLATFDSNGNLVDSGKTTSDFWPVYTHTSAVDVDMLTQTGSHLLLNSNNTNVPSLLGSSQVKVDVMTFQNGHTKQFIYPDGNNDAIWYRYRTGATASWSSWKRYSTWVYSGTSAPSSSLGFDGDVYIKY